MDLDRAGLWTGPGPVRREVVLVIGLPAVPGGEGPLYSQGQHPGTPLPHFTLHFTSPFPSRSPPYFPLLSRCFPSTLYLPYTSIFTSSPFGEEQLPEAYSLVFSTESDIGGLFNLHLFMITRSFRWEFRSVKIFEML